MTEQEWLAQSDDEKNSWILRQMGFSQELDGVWFRKDWQPDFINALSWQGFGMIVEKMPNVFYRRLGEYVTHVKVIVGSKTYTGKAPTAWEAAALAYGKMRGLIEEYAEK